MSAAAFLPPPMRPPHDPLWMRLGGSSCWPDAVASSDVEVEPGGCALRLSPHPGAERLLAEPSGSFGGLVPPANIALDDAGSVWLLGKKLGLLRHFDPCACAFVTVPCTAGDGAANPRSLIAPAGIASAGDTLYVCDAASPGRLLSFDRHSFALRAIWQPPAGSTPAPWSPRAVAVAGGQICVADPVNGGIHRFAAWGGWLGFQGGFGAVIALAFDRHGRLFVLAQGSDHAILVAPDGRRVARYRIPEQICDGFASLPFAVAANGVIGFGASCGDAAFDADGDPVTYPAPSGPAFVTLGSWTGPMLNSGISQCVWHSLQATQETGDNQRINFDTTTSEVPLSATEVGFLAPSAWTPLPPVPDGEEALILSPPGRYLWVRATLSGNGTASPRLCSMLIEYPRISLRRYLPAAFGAEPVSADFTDRLLAIFDRGFRDMETGIDDEARLFDPDSAPTGGNGDFLSWLGAWLGVALERGWPEAQQRAAVKAAAHLFHCRGTVQGLRGSLLLLLGWDRPFTTPARAACALRCCPPPAPPPMPQLVLEHWKLRRWLWLGKGRLGSDAEVWGESILRRSRLGDTARAGATRLDVTRNPLLDPFNAAANRFSVFVPARKLASAQTRAQLTRLIDEHRPADALAQMVPVHARMRIGVQASIGFDSVVGCWPAGVTLDAAQLGRATVLTADGLQAAGKRIGRSARLQPQRITARA